MTTYLPSDAKLYEIKRSDNTVYYSIAFNTLDIAKVNSSVKSINLLEGNVTLNPEVKYKMERSTERLFAESCFLKVVPHELQTVEHYGVAAQYLASDGALKNLGRIVLGLIEEHVLDSKSPDRLPLWVDSAAFQCCVGTEPSGKTVVNTFEEDHCCKKKESN